jgi:ABC-2 type transport system ATP-binding protein
MELLVENVQKCYAKVTAIKNLSFKVNQGEIFALLGPNGAGKSSLVRMLTGFTSPDSGEISLTLDGEKHTSIPSQNLGYLPEDRGLYPEKTVSKNLLYFAQLNGVDKKIALEQAKYWLERFDLLDRFDAQLKTLSKGNQQKVQLITAVIHQPKWVILDEPFSGLDPVNQEKVVTFLSELKAKGMTVILSAHQMAMVEKLADRMLLMNLGESVLYGTLAEIQQQVGSTTQLTAQFSEKISSDQLSHQFNKNEYELVDNKTLSLNLSAQQSINDALSKITALGNLTALHSKKMDLHQLYLNAIANHGALTNE